MRRLFVTTASTLCRSLHCTDTRTGGAGKESTPAEVQCEMTLQCSDESGCSPFLSSLLSPVETVPLHDVTRTYSTMDVVDPPARYNPMVPNVEPSSSSAGHMEQMLENEEEEGPVACAHKNGKLWGVFEGSEDNKPPAWFYRLCKDLFYRTNSEDNMDDAALVSDIEPSHYISSTENLHIDGCDTTQRSAEAGTDVRDGVDPYVWIPFNLLDEADYHVGPYRFPSTATYTHEQRTLLCLGDTRREYVHFCDSYAFPGRAQIPTSVGTCPSKLYVNPKQQQPVVYIQLSNDIPPAMWLPVKGTAASVRRVLAEFASMAALHRDWHHDEFMERHATAVRMLELQRLPAGEGDILRYMAYDARNAQFAFAPIREFPNQQEFFLGEHDDPEKLMEHVDLCPLLFAIPHMRTVVDLHAEHMIPTIAGPGVATSLYRCIYSKALLFVQVHLSSEVKLPPQDPEAFKFMWKDSQVLPKMRIPVFVRVVWPTNERMSGGGGLLRRFNRLFGTEFASDIPVDAAMALLYVMQWSGHIKDFLGVRGMRQRLADLLLASQQPEPTKLYPGTREIPNPEYTVAERLGMHVQYLAQLHDPDISLTIQRLLPVASAPVRMGCAKAALIAGDRELFRHIVSSEPPGRMQTYMTKLVRKRKTRDLVDAEPRLLEDQYEFAAPLWTKRGKRLDSNTLEGVVEAQSRLSG
ncbi:uncharacterized protein TEOVI_000915000 [Trypanosoma equiperdum]|uniref:Uncharacterized protein n=3 Tax=Trypanozoon TaxID=39700 RepID=Q57YY3_TRYB2|nr:hypothetical protein, conserved [Trypanosoma brucei brucei TREU927]AAX79649.1 hypothetical protein, conserved [Trypanosoma brucei]AAZ13095.1 hypothetical protein, conserved [Trypanosoma brucei brucei TREU927]SCU66132.1 hypothetical protein, conserved [Trypanosoma equiperdum]